MTRSLPPDWQTGPDEKGPDDGKQPGGNLAPTDARTIVVAVLCGAALGWFALSLYKVTNSIVPILPWSLPAMLVVVALGVMAWARAFRARVADPKREVSSGQGVATLALGKAMVQAGAALAGAGVVYVLTFIGHMSIPYPRERVIRGLVVVAACTLMAWAGWLLEKACRVPHGPDDDEHPKP